MNSGYFFDVTLPYALQIPIKNEFLFTYRSKKGMFVHIEKIKTLSEQCIEFSSHLHIPADKYGTFFKSRVRIVLNDDVVSEIYSLESEDLKKTFSQLNEYVNFCFGQPKTKLKPYVIGAINNILNMYRVISQEWHATPVTSKDLVYFTIFSFNKGKVKQLSIIPDSHRIMGGTNELFGEPQIELLKTTIRHEGQMSPFLILEADIHDKATQGEFLTACVLIALLSEEAIKEHIIQFFTKSESLHLGEAKLKLIKENGHHRSIGELVDKPKRGNSCFIHDIIGWKPFLEDEYTLWKTNVRELRNNIIHASEKDISHQQVIEAWKSCVDFIQLSRNKFIKKLQSNEIEITRLDFMKFYVPISSNIFTSGLIGEFTSGVT